MTDTQQFEFTGKIIQVEVRQATLPNGHRMEIEVVHHPGGGDAFHPRSGPPTGWREKAHRGTGASRAANGFYGFVAQP